MVEPDWLTKARQEGRITETRVNPYAIPARTAPRLPFGLDRMSEADFQSAVCDLAHLEGWKVAHFRKVRVQRSDGSVYWETPVAEDGKGWLDLVFARAGSPILIAELKVGSNTPTPEQWEWIHLLRATGNDVRVWYPSDWQEITDVLSATRPPLAPSVPVELLVLADDGCPHHEEREAA